MVQSSTALAQARSHTIVVGKSGTGKTSLIGTACDHEKVFVISLENGLQSIADKQFDFERCETYAEFKREINWFMKNYKERGYTLLAIDSITRLQRMITQDMNDKSKSSKLTYDEFAELLAIMRKLCDVITRSRDFSSIITCLDVETKDDTKGVIKENPNLEGKFAFEVFGYFDNAVVSRVGRGKDGKLTYWLEVAGDERTAAKTRMTHLRGMTTIPNDYKYLKVQ